MTQYDDHSTADRQPIDHVIPEKMHRRIVRRQASAMMVEYRSFISNLIPEILSSRTIDALHNCSDETSIHSHTRTLLEQSGSRRQRVHNTK